MTAEQAAEAERREQARVDYEAKCREVMMILDEETLDASRWRRQHNDRIGLVMWIENGHRAVDADGNIIDERARNRGTDRAEFHGPDGLHKARELVAKMHERAAALGVTIDVVIRFRPSAGISGPEGTL